MENVPWHEDVREFCVALTEECQGLGLKYELACEHVHSCCILIALTKFKPEGKWHTFIDYPK
jgi:tRNA wybutosine-synthesizing protein 1